MQKELDWLRVWLLVRNQDDIQATLPTHDLVILTKCHKDWQIL